ncbi:hypothetical protein GGR58DRAFT_495567 [Xylaria digitata]|nr:hypothetical protein GGR58DRAFT_495567 [Xylaria digitata]
MNKPIMKEYEVVDGNCIIRYEYRPSLTGRTQFTIRMNSPFHEGMVSDINRCVTLWLDSVTENNLGEYTSKTAELVRNIRPRGGPLLRVGEKGLRADCTYRYLPMKAKGPGLVVEVARSQTTKRLRKKAKEYIQESDGNIRTVLGLDFSGTYNTWGKIRDQWDRTDTPQRGPACVFVWRAVFNRETGQVSLDDKGQPKITESMHVFCNEDGEANPDERVCLKVQDFIPETVLRDQNINRKRDLRGAELFIDSSTFMSYYHTCLEEQKIFDDEDKPGRELEEANRNAKKEKAMAR